jgi:short-subunit dehydrogenase
MFFTKLRGARILLTGASSGIGHALAHELARRGARLALTARSAERLEALAADLRKAGAEALTLTADLAEVGQRQPLIEKAVAGLGGLDVLINNAGVGATGYFADAGEARLRQVIEVNLLAPVDLIRHALPHLYVGRQPMIVNVGSVLGRRGVPGYGDYCASKFGLSGFSESLRAELAGFGVHVLLVSPGLIDTPFRDHLIEDRLRTKWRKLGVLSPEKCARQIVSAMRWRTHEIVITLEGKFLCWLQRFVPGFVEFLMARYSREQESV